MIKQDNVLGYSLVELLVAMTIFVMIAGTAVANLRDGARNESVSQAAQLAASLLRTAQTRTLTGAVLDNGDFPDGGYGVRFDADDTNRVLFFADINGSKAYEAGEELILDTIDLPSNTRFTLGDNLEVLFYPVEGSIYFGGLASPDVKTVTFAANGTNVQKNVVITRLSGQVRVQ